ncbi:pyridine nucleotide-disulfide oxidoreductase [Devosia sp. Root685]|uniref:NAD(P)/FAD-dependent oxidoreductase n=1 Tax=Devosia sp. Root685 TaxID=1736587 RepID=UPI0006F2C93E|nr:NAD(P)/FAD-dependent oxidoreductase [Devosia sp. Root685]KRA96624.1 pyridine nucleotide-disulfide oxidoreductase [Devosia sp. Root685]
MQDVIIIGGSFAGLTAAMQLGRARRKVTVLDTGLNRNRYAEHAHNIFGHDGTPPGELLASARAQIAHYPTVKMISGKAVGISGEPDNFAVTTAEGETISGRRLILSYGIVDEFPAIPGFAESWGKTVIHCPFCHGYEVAGTRWGLVYSSPMSLHGPILYANWTDDITLILDGHEIIAEERHKLEQRGVKIVDGKLAAIHHEAGRISGVTMADGEKIGLEALYAHPHNRPSADLHLQLGLDMKDTPTGTMIAVSDMQLTSRPGIFAAGDLTTGMHSVTFANNTGSMAAMGALQSMMV